MEKFSRGTFFFGEITDVVRRQHILTHAHTTKHKQTQPNTNNQTTKQTNNQTTKQQTQPNTNKHRQTQTNTDTSPISCTGRPTSFQVARGLHSFDTNKFVSKQGMSQSTGTLTLWQVRESECTEREPDWTSDHCHCC